MSLHAASMGGCAPAGKQIVVDGPHPADSNRHFSGIRPRVRQVCERIFRDWLRGVTERSLAKMHRLKRPAIEEVCREQAKAMAAALRSAASRTAGVFGKRRMAEDGGAE